MSRLLFNPRLQYQRDPLILNYVLAYFQKHQNSPADNWFNSDAKLHANIFGNAAQKMATTISQNARSPTKSTLKSLTTLVSVQVCLNWNRPTTGCKIKEHTGTHTVFENMYAPNSKTPAISPSSAVIVTSVNCKNGNLPLANSHGFGFGLSLQ